MNKDVSKRESLVALLVKFDLNIFGNETCWKLLKSDMTFFVDHDFKSIGELNNWSRKYLQKLEDAELEKQGGTKKGGLQLGMFGDE